MPKNKSIRINFIMNVILTMSSILFPLITFPYVSRVLTPVGTGKVSFASSVIAYFLMISQLGIPTYGIRICAMVRDDRQALSKTVHELLFINLLMTAISYILLYAGILFVPRLRCERTLYLIMSVSILLDTLGMEWLYKALEQYTYIALRSMAFKFIALVLMFVLIHTSDDYMIYGALVIFAASASNIINFINCRKFVDLKRNGGYDIRRHIKPVAVFFALACAATIYTNLDAVMLGFMKTDADVGYYNAAVKIKAVLVSIVTSLGAVLLPRASYYVEQGRLDDFRIIYKKALNFVTLAAVPMLVYFIIFAKECILFLSGDAYIPSVFPMQLIIPTVLFIGFTNILGIQILVPLGREKTVLYSEIAGAVTDMLLNWFLIPPLGAAGAAIGTVAAEAVVLIYQYISLRNEVRAAFIGIEYHKIIVPAIAAGIVASLFRSSDVFATLALSALLYALVYFALIVVLKEKLVRELSDDLGAKLKKKFG